MIEDSNPSVLTRYIKGFEMECGGVKFAPTAPLSLDHKLTEAAVNHAIDMSTNNYFSHDSPNGRKLKDRVDATKYNWRTIGENIAHGHKSGKDVVAGWIKSPGHCKNVMNPEFKNIGIGMKNNYWVQVFGTSK